MGVDAGKAGSYAAGLLFGVGWWLFVDGAASAAARDSQIPLGFVSYLPGVVSTLAFFMCVRHSFFLSTPSRAFSLPSSSSLMSMSAGSTHSTGRW